MPVRLQYPVKSFKFNLYFYNIFSLPRGNTPWPHTHLASFRCLSRICSLTRMCSLTNALATHTSGLLQVPEVGRICSLTRMCSLTRNYGITTYTHTHTHTHTYTHTHVHTHVCICMYVSVCMHVRIHTHTHYIEKAYPRLAKDEDGRRFYSHSMIL